MYESLMFASHQDWLDARREGVGGSDVGQILGVSPWGDAAAVWDAKVHEVDVPESEPMRIGSLLEPQVLQLAHEYLRSEGYLVVHEAEPDMCVLEDDPVCRYSPDGFVTIVDGVSESKVLLEAKVTSKMPDEPLPSWVAQVKWGMGITGRDVALITALCGSRASYFWVESDPVWFADARVRVRQFWDEHVVSEVRPVIVPVDPETVVELDHRYAAELSALYGRWHSAKSVADGYEAEYRKALNAGIDMYGAGVWMDQGRKLGKVSVVKSRRADWKTVAQAKGLEPEYTVSESVRMTWSKK